MTVHEHRPHGPYARSVRGERPPGAAPRRRAHGGAPVEDVDLAARRELEDAPLEEVVPARAERVDDAPLFVGPLRGLHLRQAALRGTQPMRLGAPRI